MRDNRGETLCVLALLTLVVLLFSVASQRDNLKEEAVKRGFAEWKVDPNGDATWQWKEARK